MNVLAGLWTVFSAAVSSAVFAFAVTAGSVFFTGGPFSVCGLRIISALENPPDWNIVCGVVTARAGSLGFTCE